MNLDLQILAAHTYSTHTIRKILQLNQIFDILPVIVSNQKQGGTYNVKWHLACWLHHKCLAICLLYASAFLCVSEG